jgi:hypothetical protein
MRLLVLAFLLFFSSCQNKKKIEFSSAKVSESDQPKIEFLEKTHDFGEIKEGEVVSHVFKFKNTGTMPLQITGVDVTCGCTVAEKPEKPVGIGQLGEIKVQFNSAGKSGVNQKQVTVHSNAQNSPEIVGFNVVVLNQTNQ